MARKPVVFIPGFPATELLDAQTREKLFPPTWWQTLPFLTYKKKLLDRLISDRDGVVAGDPILKVTALAKQASSLYDNLAHLGYDMATDFQAVGWDWRKGIDDPLTQSAIAKAIDRFSERVVLMVHSTGGLVFRAFVEEHPAYAAKVEFILAFGVPWVGTLDAFKAITTGISSGVGPIGFTAREVQRLTSTCQAAYDLCPPDPAQTEITTPLFTKQGIAASPLVTPAEWTNDPAMQALAAKAHARFGARNKSFDAPPIVNICGWGALTLDSCALSNGKLTFGEEVSGDTTVPFVSSSWLRDDGDRVKAFYVPIGAYERNAIPEPHPRIWDSPPVLGLLASLLGGAAAKPFLAAAVDPDDNFPSRDPVRIRVSAADANGRSLPNARIVLRLAPSQTFALQPGQRRLEIALRRAGLPNNANGYARIEVEAIWTGGSARTAIAIRV